jgi:hypothetical protein
MGQFFFKMVCGWKPVASLPVLEFADEAMSTEARLFFNGRS